jgi:aspartyl-tRNA(Asn)/glutamyl-tRNA(Gln) amidotransferase subunit B
MTTDFETVVGLEVHAELATKSKIFCGCGAEFGAPPNTRVCPVCMGAPGSLPVLNKQAVNFAIMAGLALNCSINRKNKFDRKNYFYPDLPKAYQISQLYAPICQNGFLSIKTPAGEKKIGIHEIHLEEDAGKLIHDPWEDASLVDYNRCGVPLIEIVSDPDFRNADEVVAYLEKLRETLLYLGISDCKLQEGSMRADINLSVRPVGSPHFGVRTEMKNMNSFKAIYKAVIHESKRQIETITAGGRITQQTRRWDDNKDASFAMRNKESAQDYRYFPEPDLLPLNIDDKWIESIVLPESAEAKRARFVAETGITAYDAGVLTSEKALCDLFEKTSALCGAPKEVSNQITVEALRVLKELGSPAEDIGKFLSPEKFSELIKLILNGKINRSVGKEVLEKIFTKKIDPAKYVEENGLAIVEDDSLIEETICEVLKNNPKSIEDFKAGKQKAFAFLVGQSMKKLKGKANPVKINEILKAKLELSIDLE